MDTKNLIKDYLLLKNFKILHRNFYSRYGEVDIIASDNKFIAFVEVKPRKTNALDKGSQRHGPPYSKG